MKVIFNDTNVMVDWEGRHYGWVKFDQPIPDHLIPEGMLHVEDHDDELWVPSEVYS